MNKDEKDKTKETDDNQLIPNLIDVLEALMTKNELIRKAEDQDENDKHAS